METLQWLPTSARPADPMLLVSSADDGKLQVWKVGLTSQFMCWLPGAVGHLASVRDACCDSEHQHLIICDSSGHVKVWDTSALDASSGDALRDSFKLVRPCQVLVRHRSCSVAARSRSAGALRRGHTFA